MKIAIFAAGTGGHIYPALTIAKEFNKQDIIFFASSRKLEKKIYIHEQNSVIGTLNKFAKNFSHKFFSSFQNIASNEIYTGNPIRNKITTKGYELNKEKKSILVLGGLSLIHI